MTTTNSVAWTTEHEMLLDEGIEKYPPFGDMLHYNLLNICAFMNRFVCLLASCVLCWGPFVFCFVDRPLASFDRCVLERQFSLKEIYDRVVSLYNVHHEVRLCCA